MKKRLPCLAFALLASALSGCLYVADIEEQENLPPFIDPAQLKPNENVIDFDLSKTLGLDLIAYRYGDDNETDILYHRLIIAPQFANASVSKQITVSPNNRTPIRYYFAPCTQLKNNTNALQENASINIALLLTDTPFKDPQAFPQLEDFQTAYQTITATRVAEVQWKIRLQGTCPSSSTP